MRTTPFVVLLTLLGGCTYVTQDKYDQRLTELDNDLDGFYRDGGGDPAKVDCDDANANINPGQEDPWYDGVDSNCDGANDYDQDGDGYVLRGCQDYSDCQGALGFGDCDDEDTSVNPEATDTWYDGVDQDCDSRDDYDQDGDGAQSAEHTTGGRDCDDLDPDIGPHAEEIWYDGVDQDCDDRNDYDRDNDGWVIADCQQSSDCEGRNGFGDCDDADALVHPTATDLWYDAVDSNCDGADDFDRDGDGFASAVYGGDDCDDFDPEVHPGGVEDLTDPFTDGDCDGSATSVALTTMDATFRNPSNLRVGEHSSSVYFTVTAEELTYGTGERYFDTAVASGFLFNRENPTFQSNIPWPNATTTDGSPVVATGQGFGVYRFDSKTHMCGATGLLTASRRLAITCYQLTEGGSGSGTRLIVADSESSTNADFDDIAFGVDGAGAFHALGCSSADGGSIQYLVASQSALLAQQGFNRALFTGVQASNCSIHFHEDGGATGTLGFTDAASGDYVIATWNAAAAPGQAFTSNFHDAFTVIYRGPGLSPLDIEYPEDVPYAVEVYVTGTGELWLRGAGFSARVNTPRPVINANLTWNPTNSKVYVAWADITGDAGLAWGDPTSGNGFTIAGMSTEFLVVEAVPWIAATGDLFLGALGETQMAVTGTLAP